MFPLIGLMTCLTPPCPPSPVIESIEFDPPEQIILKAEGSDNWPITWADDDCLYAAYGDGWGFEPKIDRKLSLGFAKIIGFPPNFRGINIRSPSGERTGDGPKGPKASGMLMVGGLLYMLVRNVGNSMLMWSEDHGLTWREGFKFKTSFGCPTFLNFGRNYEGARDEYVYIYSPDGPSAYESYDGVVLARVHRERIRERGAYEFFAGLDDEGRPIWTKEIEERRPVFVFPGRCGRLDVVYNPSLKRYMMALGFDRGGGWGIFDAPEPWGPWTASFLTERWDCGNTHSYRIPSKWISKDGLTFYLVFSGRSRYDAFCVRRATVKLRGEMGYNPSPKGGLRTWTGGSFSEGR